MKNRSEDGLLDDIFSKSRNLRETSLEQLLSSARGQRRRRTIVYVGSLATVCLALSFFPFSSRIESNCPTPRVASVSTEPNFPTVPGTNIRILNDEELLAMFGDRPVALLGPPEERQFVVLDEIRDETSVHRLN